MHLARLLCRYICVRVLLCMCPHTTIYPGCPWQGFCAGINVSAYCCISVRILLYVSSYYYVFWMTMARLLCRYKCVNILLYICPHTNIYVSSYYCVFCINVSTYYCISIASILMYMCRHMYMSSYVYVLILRIARGLLCSTFQDIYIIYMYIYIPIYMCYIYIYILCVCVYIYNYICIYISSY